MIWNDEALKNAIDERQSRFEASYRLETEHLRQRVQKLEQVPLQSANGTFHTSQPSDLQGRVENLEFVLKLLLEREGLQRV